MPRDPPDKVRLKLVFVRQVLVASTHHDLLFFTDRGRVYRLKCYDIARESSRSAKGIPVVNLIAMDSKERVTQMLAIPSYEADRFLVVATRMGEVKKTSLSEFSAVRSSGLIAMDLEASDELIGARVVEAGDQVILATEKGQSIKFAVSELRSASRTSGGVRGIRPSPGDNVVSLEVADPNAHLLTVTSKGYGKRTLTRLYPAQRRGGSGVRTFKIVPKTGRVITALAVYPSQELMLISAKGIVIRTSVDGISVQGRGTQGVSVMKVEQGDRVVSVGCLGKE